MGGAALLYAATPVCRCSVRERKSCKITYYKGVNMAQLQDLGNAVPLPPSGDVSSALGTSIVIRGAQTAKVKLGGVAVWTQWDGELYSGKGVLTTGLVGQVGPFLIEQGELYVRSTTVTGPPTASMIQSPVPVVIQKGTVVAGSVGTHWFVWADSEGKVPTLWFVLLKHPTEPLGRVEVYDGAKSAHISLANHYLELPNNSLPTAAVQQPLAAGSPLEQRVMAAIQRTLWQSP